MKHLICLVMLFIITTHGFASKIDDDRQAMSVLKIKYKKKDIVLMLAEDAIHFKDGDIDLLKKAMWDSKYRKTLTYPETMQLITLYYLIMAQSKILDLSNTNDLILNALKKMIMIGENKRQNEDSNK
jgi:hypothetical protein